MDDPSLRNLVVEGRHTVLFVSFDLIVSRVGVFFELRL